jgi:hypothetical protein
MAENNRVSRGRRRRQVLPILAVFAAAVVYSLLPLGAFGTHDLLARAAVTGAAAALAYLLFRGIDTSGD